MQHPIQQPNPRNIQPNQRKENATHRCRILRERRLPKNQPPKKIVGNPLSETRQNLAGGEQSRLSHYRKKEPNLGWRRRGSSVTALMNHGWHVTRKTKACEGRLWWPKKRQKYSPKEKLITGKTVGTRMQSGNSEIRWNWTHTEMVEKEEDIAGKILISWNKKKKYPAVLGSNYEFSK